MEFVEETVEYAPNAEGKPTIVGTKRTKKFIPPNPTAVLFGLKNVDKDNFSETIKNEHTGKNGGPIKTTGTVTHNVNFKRSDGTAG